MRDDIVVVGFAGEAATGKTSTADALVPGASSQLFRDEGSSFFGLGYNWTHLSFALPLYQMASARRDIEGHMSRDRQLYEIHRTLLDTWDSPLFGGPSYDQLVEMAYQIQEFPITTEGKPRDFFQYVGTDLCRAFDRDCWVRWMRKKIDQEHRDFILQRRLDGHGLDEEDEDPLFGVIISDVRYQNEAEFIKRFKNSRMIRFTARPEVIQERLLERDGRLMTREQNGHETETSVRDIDKKLFDATIDTSDLTLEEQVNRVRELIQPIGAVNGQD